MSNNRVGRFRAPSSDIPIGINPPSMPRKPVRKKATGARRALTVGRGKKVGLRRRRQTVRKQPVGTGIKFRG